MRSLFFISIGILVVAAGCSNRNKESDAFGNFTATEILVSSEISGKVLTKFVTEGETIDSGAIVYVIDTLQNFLKKEELLARKASVLAKRSNLSAQIAVLNEQKVGLERDMERFTHMLNDGAASQKQIDDISNNLTIISKQIDQVKTNFSSVDADANAMDASIAQTEDMIKRASVRAPATGTILETYAEVGETAAPGKSLFKIANLNTMELKAYFSGKQVPSLSLGQEVKVVVDDGMGGTRELKGTISWIAANAEFTPKIIQTREERVNLVYAVKIKVQNDGSVKINMPGEVRLVHQNNQ
jgi:HlyD family secretion protein